MKLRAFLHVSIKGVPKSRINDGWENGNLYVKRNKADGQPRPHLSATRGQTEHHVKPAEFLSRRFRATLTPWLFFMCCCSQLVLNQHAGFLLPLETPSENLIFHLPHLKIKRLFKMQSYEVLCA